MSSYVIHCGDCLDVMRTMPDNSVDAIITDPPYFKMSDAEWDRAWDDADAFLTWFDSVAAEWARLLRGNGSLYCFASPAMSSRVEMRIRERFDVLNVIRWVKPDQAGGRQMDIATLRSYWSPWESLIFAEHYGADNRAKGAAGYEAKCDELRGFVFEPLRAYLDGERQAAGWTCGDINRALSTYMARHWFAQSQWELPTAENYQRLRDLFNGRGGDNLRREYDDLRREYDDLRRPFAVTREHQFCDVWEFNQPRNLDGKRHPCEKPVDLLRHAIGISTRPGAVILDSFCGSGSTGDAAVSLGRDFIGIEKDATWCARARERLAGVAAQGDLLHGGNNP